MILRCPLGSVTVLLMISFLFLVMASEKEVAAQTPLSSRTRSLLKEYKQSVLSIENKGLHLPFWQSVVTDYFTFSSSSYDSSGRDLQDASCIVFEENALELYAWYGSCLDQANLAFGSSGSNSSSGEYEEQVLSQDTITSWCAEDATSGSGSCFSQLTDFINAATADGSDGCLMATQSLSMYGAICSKHPETDEYCWVNKVLPINMQGSGEGGDITNEDLEEMCSPCYIQFMNLMSPTPTNEEESYPSYTDMYCQQIDGVYCVIFSQLMMNSEDKEVDFVVGNYTIYDLACHPCTSAFMAPSVSNSSETDDYPAMINQMCNTFDEAGQRCYGRMNSYLLENEELFYDDNTTYCIDEFDENGIMVCDDNCANFLSRIESALGCCTDGFITLMGLDYNASMSFNDFVTNSCGHTIPDSCDADVASMQPQPSTTTTSIDNESLATSTTSIDDETLTTTATSIDDESLATTTTSIGDETLTTINADTSTGTTGDNEKADSGQTNTNTTETSTAKLSVFTAGLYINLMFFTELLWLVYVLV